MKKLLLPFLVFLMSCDSSTKIDNAIVISDLDADFPVTDTISLSLRQTFEILPRIFDCKTIDSVLYVAEEGIDNCGHCYNINTGEQISTIVTCGKANNEMLNVVKLSVVGDSIQLFDAAWQSSASARVSIKTFAHKDFLTKPIGERKFSTVILPDSLFAGERIKTSEGEVYGTIPKTRNPYNNLRYFAYGDNGTTYFGEMLSGLVELKVKLNDKNIRSFNLIFDDMYLAYFDDRIAAADDGGIMLEVIDTKQKEVTRGKYYNKYIFEERYVGSTSVSPVSDYRTSSVSCTKENIFCHVVTSVKENGKFVDKNFILVFDWELNPVKRFYIGNSLDGDLFWFSGDCKSICRMNINAEKQELFEGKIVL